jgi:hypothetical protein
MNSNMAYIRGSHQQNVAWPMIQTTIYDLVEAVNEAAGPEKEEWVPLIVARMLKKGKSIPV